jgi:photosystem II stability/assembly factor-like uncharacterized protein
VYDLNTVKSKFVAALILVLAFAGCSWADWNEQASGTTQTLNSIYFYNTTTGFAAGANGTAIKTTDGGANWAPLTSGTVETINDVIFPSATEGYFVGTNGVVLKTTDAGGTFSQVGGLPQANYKKAAYSGSTRVLAGSMGDSAAGYLVTNWVAAPTPDFAIDGVYLSSGGTWMWGKYIAGTYNGQNVIVSREASDTVVWQSTTSSVADIFFASASVGYAVGSGGLVLKTTDAGNNWTTLTSGTIEALNAVVFASENIGWVAGENGVVLFTTDGGTNFSAYTMPDPTVDIKDIMLKVVGSGYVHAWISGSGGKIYKLAAPTITSVSPGVAKQGKIGTIEVIGTGFMSGAVVSFSDPDVAVSSTVYDSATRLVANYVVSLEAATGAKDVIVTNPDSTTTEEANAFTINANTAPVTFQNIRLDYSAYMTPEANGDPRTTVTIHPQVSFEVYSSQGLSKGTLNARVFASYTDASGDEVYIFADDVSDFAEGIDQYTMEINYPMTREALPSCEVVAFSLYAEDIVANVGQENMPGVKVATEAISDPCPNPSPPPGSGGLPLVVVPVDHIIDPEVENIQLQLVLTPGVMINNFTVYIFDMFGREVVSKKYVDQRVVGKFNLTISNDTLRPHLITGLQLVRVINDDNGDLLGKNLLMFAPKHMHTK